METFRNSGRKLLFNVNISDSLNAINAGRSAWILVGGRSSRMGSDKARAEVEGRALALRVADLAATVCGTVSLIGDPAKYSDLGLPVIADRFPGEGPLAGIEAALNASATDENLILACDLPSINPAVFKELFEAGGNCAVPRHDNGHVEPLCSVWRKSCHPIVLSALEAGIRKVTEVLPLVAVRYVRVTDPSAFANLNTPEDLKTYGQGQ